MEQLYFFMMLTLAIIVSRTPLRRPFQWMETYFHELSHGLAAILTFGWIKRIDLSFNGAGCCWTVGGLRIPVLLAGYAGAVTWGALIFLAGWQLDTFGDITLLRALLVVMAITTLLWTRTIQTLIIMLIMMTVLYVPTLYVGTSIPAYAIEFYGLYIVQSAISAPLDLIDGRHEGDGAALADITLIIPEGIWIAGWFAYALITLFWLWQIITPIHQRFMQDYPYLPLI